MRAILTILTGAAVLSPPVVGPGGNPFAVAGGAVQDIGKHSPGAGEIATRGAAT